MASTTATTDGFAFYGCSKRIPRRRNFFNWFFVRNGSFALENELPLVQQLDSETKIDPHFVSNLFQSIGFRLLLPKSDILKMHSETRRCLFTYRLYNSYEKGREMAEARHRRKKCTSDKWCDSGDENIRRRSKRHRRCIDWTDNAIRANAMRCRWNLGAGTQTTLCDVAVLILIPLDSITRARRMHYSWAHTLFPC